jgi:hypothetical protein
VAAPLFSDGRHPDLGTACYGESVHTQARETSEEAESPTGKAFLRPWVWSFLMAGAMFVGIFLLYFLVYRVRHFALPLGWDTPWYVWRADFIGHMGMGPLDTAARPGHALLTATLGSATGLSSLQLQVIVPYVLVAAFALVMGAAVAEALGSGERWRWALGAAVAGIMIGTTRLVGENVANLMDVLFVAVAFLLIARFAVLGRGLTGAILMLIAAGLAHWLFLGVFALVMVAWFGLSLPSSYRTFRSGTRPWRTEAGALAVAGGATGAAMAVLIYPVLGSSLRTFEIHEAKSRYIPKLKEDLGAMWAAVLGPVAAAGGVALVAEERTRSPKAVGIRPAFLRMVLAWALVSAGGMGYAAITLALPPHRFLTVLVVVPGVVAVCAAIWTVCRVVARRADRMAAATVGVVAVALLAVPTLVWWYGPKDLKGPEEWLDPAAFQQAREAGAYMQQLPPSEAVVILVGPRGSSGPISSDLKERTIRAALSPERQVPTHVYPGEPADLLAGRPSPVTGPQAAAINRENRPFWEDVLRVLPRNPPLLVLQQLAPAEFHVATTQLGAHQIAPGVALLRGHEPSPAIAVPPPLHPVPRSVVGLLEGAAIALLLGTAGLGWAIWFLGSQARSLTVVSLAPALGAGMVTLGALVTAKAGLHLSGPAGVVTLVVVAAAGGALAFASPRRTKATLAQARSGEARPGAP